MAKAEELANRALAEEQKGSQLGPIWIYEQVRITKIWMNIENSKTFAIKKTLKKHERNPGPNWYWSSIDAELGFWHSRP